MLEREMVRLVFSIIFLVVLALFIALNAQFSTDVNLFGHRLTAVPTVAVVLLTLVVGVLYSFGLYLITYFAKRRAEKAKELKRKNAEKAKELKSQEEELETAKAALPPAEAIQPAAPGSSAPARVAKTKPRILKRFNRKSKRR